MSRDLDAGHKELVDLAQARMPFGKYQGRRLIDLPENYLVWFANQGFPEGQLGRRLQAVYEIKLNGLESLFDPLTPISTSSHSSPSNKSI